MNPINPFITVIVTILAKALGEVNPSEYLNTPCCINDLLGNNPIPHRRTTNIIISITTIDVNFAIFLLPNIAG